MSDQNKTFTVKEKFRQLLERLGEALEEVIPRPQLQPRPIPVNRPHRRRTNLRNFR